MMNMISTGNVRCFFDENGKEIFDRNIDPRSKNSTGVQKVEIGNDVWIGANVFINASRCSKIGDGAIMGTNSVVLQDIPLMQLCMELLLKLTVFDSLQSKLTFC